MWSCTGGSGASSSIEGNGSEQISPDRIRKVGGARAMLTHRSTHLHVIIVQHNIYTHIYIHIPQSTQQVPLGCFRDLRARLDTCSKHQVYRFVEHMQGKRVEVNDLDVLCPRIKNNSETEAPTRQQANSHLELALTLLSISNHHVNYLMFNAGAIYNHPCWLHYANTQYTCTKPHLSDFLIFLGE